MRLSAIIGLFLYGAANLFAGIYGVTVVGGLPVHVTALLILTGFLLSVASVLLLRRSPNAIIIAAISLVSAFALALYNERILGAGHPSHHLFRGAFAVLVLWAAIRATRNKQHK